MSRPLTVLTVAYPFAPVGAEAAGGAEQVAAMLDEAIVAAGHRSVVVGQEGSTCAGELVAVSRRPGPIDPDARRRTQAVVESTVARLSREVRPDVVHMHGCDFDGYLPPEGVPVLVTLHLPLSSYAASALRPQRPRTWLHGVSAAQMRDAPIGMPRLPEIPNGVRLDRFQPFALGRRRYSAVIARICPEKGIHLGIDAARRARVPLLVAGKVFPYEEHARYFRELVEPRLGSHSRFIGTVGPRRKQRLLACARSLLVPSLIDETSSLVAMEALACGTPVVAFRIGALPSIVDHGRTGFLVDDVRAMGEAIGAVGRLSRPECRAEAERRFSSKAMTERYLTTYRQLASGEVAWNS